MRKTVQLGLVIWALVSFMTCSSPGQAIRLAKAQPISPDAPVTSLSLTASPSSVSFGLVAKGIASGSSGIAITTTWGRTMGCAGSCTITLYAYFSSATAALSGGGSPVVNIPSSEVLGQVPTGSPTTFTAFTQSNPLGGGGASLLLFSQSFSPPGTSGGSRTDTLNLEIDLTNQPQLPAGAYTGTLYIQAQSL